MGTFRLLLAASAFGLLQNHLLAQPQSIPQVISPTGQPYGPTQAHYQYFKQYGVPYNGYTGLDIANGYPVPATGGYSYGHGHHVVIPYGYGPSYPFGGYGGYVPPAIVGGPVFVSPLSPGVTYYGDGSFYGNPALMQPLPPQLPSGTFSPLMEDSIQQERDRWQQPLIGTRPAPTAMKLVEKSTPEAQLRSVRLQAQGDREVQGLKFTAATASYTQAVRTARDQVDPRVKLALTQATRRNYAEAIHELKLALALDPTYPAHALRLDDFYGEQNYSAKVMIKSRILDWAKEDVRDPDRLFLMGAVLHFDGDSRGLILIETAARLAGQEPHLMAFLSPEAVSAVSAQQPADGAQPAPDPQGFQPVPADQPQTLPPVLILPELPALPSLEDQARENRVPPNAELNAPPAAEPGIP